MKKEEFLKLKGPERYKIMSKAFNAKDQKVVKTIMLWEKELLEQRGYSNIPGWGWQKDEDILDMGINPDTGDVVPDDVVEETDYRTKQVSKTKISRKHNDWTRRKAAQDASSRGFMIGVAGDQSGITRKDVEQYL